MAALLPAELHVTLVFPTAELHAALEAVLSIELHATLVLLTGELLTGSGPLAVAPPLG